MALQTIAGLAAAAALGAGSLALGPTPDTVDPPRVPCGAVWQRLPEELRTDLTALRDLTPADRPEAARAIRRAALRGDYGADVQRVAERRDERRAWLRERLPEELRQDLRSAAGSEPGDRRDAFRAVRDNALAGEYGERVQTLAEALQERRAACGVADS